MCCTGTRFALYPSITTCSFAAAQEGKAGGRQRAVAYVLTPLRQCVRNLTPKCHGAPQVLIVSTKIFAEAAENRPIQAVLSVQWPFSERLLTLEGQRMEHLDSVPHFVEPGDTQDTVLALPIFVTRPADEATRKQRLAVLAAAPEQAKNNTAEWPSTR